MDESNSNVEWKLQNHSSQAQGGALIKGNFDSIRHIMMKVLSEPKLHPDM